MPVAKGVSVDPARTRAAIVRAAGEMLYQRGLDGIGVAELCSAMGISKETLYRHFGSKDGLIVAVLQSHSDRMVRWLTDELEAAGPDPATRLATLFDLLRGWYAAPGFRGCAVVNAATQRHAGPPRMLAARHLSRYLDLLTDIAARADVADPPLLGKQLLILLEGAIVVADHHAIGAASAEYAKRAALTLLDAAMATAAIG